MRRVVLLLATMAGALVVASGLALADHIVGNAGNNRLVGTPGKDTISGAGGHDDIFGKGGRDRLFGDSGNDDLFGGTRGDRLQGGLGQDELFGQRGNDFVDAIDGQTNDSANCGKGNEDVAAIDAPTGDLNPADSFAGNCEFVYVAVGPFETSDDRGTASSSIDTREEAERAEAEGLLKQIR